MKVKQIKKDIFINDKLTDIKQVNNNNRHCTYYNQEYDVFIKTCNNSIAKQYIQNEFNILSKLQNYKYFPKILAYQNNILITNNCGNQFKKLDNKYLYQIYEIESILEKENIQHNDLHLHNVMFKDDQVYFIDFGHATYNQQPTVDINTKIKQYIKYSHSKSNIKRILRQIKIIN